MDSRRLRGTTIANVAYRPTADIRTCDQNGRDWPKAARPFSGENRKKRTFTRGSETGLPRRGRSRREHALADGLHRSSPRDGEMPYAGCWLSRTADSF